jgi:hypothetical protein
MENTIWIVWRSETPYVMSPDKMVSVHATKRSARNVLRLKSGGEEFHHFLEPANLKDAHMLGVVE